MACCGQKPTMKRSEAEKAAREFAKKRLPELFNPISSFPTPDEQEAIDGLIKTLAELCILAFEEKYTLTDN
ncbi:MAG: hypothetical protein Q7R73_00725 [bacterium]|nr:hypothetical protein [bacterium]